MFVCPECGCEDGYHKETGDYEQTPCGMLRIDSECFSCGWSQTSYSLMHNTKVSDAA
jgi:hypothetical protein